jgi:AraC family transcriptional regulator, positive regulator of tynA and feaB
MRLKTATIFAIANGHKGIFALMALITAVVGGRTTFNQNDQAVELAVGDVALIESARPVRYVNHGQEKQSLVLQLPRQRLISSLGFEPRGGLRGHSGTRASRLLFQLVVDAVDDEEPMPTSAGNYMQLAVYDLLGALLAPSDPASGSLHSDRLFKRICDVIRGALPSQISVRVRLLPRSVFPYDTSKNCSRSAVVPAAASFNQCAWIKGRAVSSAGRR